MKQKGGNQGMAVIKEAELPVDFQSGEVRPVAMSRGLPEIIRAPRVVRIPGNPNGPVCVASAAISL